MNDSDNSNTTDFIISADYIISTNKRRLDIDAMHAFLTRSYWSPGVTRAIVERFVANSLCFGVYHRRASSHGDAPRAIEAGPDSGAHAETQIGFARAVTDKTTFAYLADVYILETHRGQGLSKRLVRCILDHPDLQGLRRFMLATKDAHTLYQQFGFRELSTPSLMMEIVDPAMLARLKR
jgi:GNAT superfamily N-acetyltransferase